MGEEEEKEHFSTHSMRPVLPRYQNWKYISQKACRPIYLMNIDAKTYNKIAANQTQLHLRSTIQHNQMEYQRTELI